MFWSVLVFDFYEKTCCEEKKKRIDGWIGMMREVSVWSVDDSIDVCEVYRMENFGGGLVWDVGLSSLFRNQNYVRFLNFSSIHQDSECHRIPSTFHLTWPDVDREREGRNYSFWTCRRFDLTYLSKFCFLH